MNLPHYNYSTSNYKYYGFYSNGPKGRVKKVVIFTKLSDEPITYNLAFGDQDPETGLVSDSVIGNNHDRDIVLATVANTINDFCDHYGNHFVYATGSNTARTRLYQISISKLLDEINADFEVYGIINGKSFPFQKNVNYEAFLVKRKVKPYI